MKAPTSLLIATLLALVAAPSAEALAQALPAKKKKSAPEKSASLPAYKGKKKITVDFEKNSGTHTGSTVVVRTPLPLDEALKDHDAAEKSMNNEVATVQGPSSALENPQASQIQVQEMPTPLPEISLVPSSPASKAKTQIQSQKQSKKSQKQLQLQVTSRPQTPPVVAPPELEPVAPPVEPPAPTVTETKPPQEPIVEPFIAPKITVQELELEKPAASPKVDAAAAQAIVAVVPVTVPVAAEPTRFFVQTSYLNAQYSRVDERLENGATTISLGLGREIRSIEARGILEFGHGLDQTVSPRTTRMTILKGEALRIFRARHVSPFVGAGLGYADLYLFSYRSQSGDTQTIREHIKTVALMVSPIVGARANLPHTGGLVLDLTAEYLVLLGAGKSADLGGLLGRLSLGIPF